MDSLDVGKFSICITSDGSHTIKNETTGDTYHSIHGAIQESDHVFIQSGLRYFIDATSAKNVRILEVGFGTGLNALLTMQACERMKIHGTYTALEPFPLEQHLTNGLNYETTDSNFKYLHEARWNCPIHIEPNFSLNKIKDPVGR